MKIIRIDKCLNCPYNIRFSDKDKWFCYHDWKINKTYKEIIDEDKEYTFPTWCPLEDEE